MDVAATENEQEIFNIICKKYADNKLALFIRILQLESNPQMLLQKLDLSEFRNILDITDDIDNIGFVDYALEVKELVEAINITSKKKSCIEKVKQLVMDKKKVIIWCIFVDSQIFSGIRRRASGFSGVSPFYAKHGRKDGSIGNCCSGPVKEYYQAFW